MPNTAIDPITLPALDPDGKLRIGPRLGVGGMAEVFQGWKLGSGDNEFQMRVAIKLVLPQWSGDSHFRESFLREAKIAGSLDHPNIVRTFDVGIDKEGRLYQVMELVVGTDLRRLIMKGPLPVPIAAYIVGQILRALSHVHGSKSTTTGRARGLVHRDIKPENILISCDGTVKIADFGIAKATQATHATNSGRTAGTPRYMSPEQLARPHLVDARTDLFAVGCVLWEVLTGCQVFASIETDMMMCAVAEGRIPIPALHAPHLPRDLVQVAQELISFDLNQRPCSAEAVFVWLRRWLPADGPEQLRALLIERFAGQGAWFEEKRSEAITKPGTPRRASETNVLPQPAQAVALSVSASAAIGEVSSQPRMQRRWPRLLVGGLALSGGLVALLVVVITIARGGSREVDGTATRSKEAAVVSIDASERPVDTAGDVAEVEVDAGIDLDVDAGIDAAIDAPLDAPKPHRPPRPPRTTKPKAGTIVEINLGGGQQP